MIENLLKDRARAMRREPTEADGGQHANSAYDAERGVWLGSRGSAVLRFWNDEVLRNSRDVQHTIATRLGLEWLA
jgi:very-short-patch-repair endonuclease